MTIRDNTIEKKLQELTAEIEKTEKEIKDCKNYETNLVIDTDSGMINLRAAAVTTLASFEKLKKAYEYIHRLAENEANFKKEIEGESADINDSMIGAYTYSQWVGDIKKIYLDKKLSKKKIDLENSIQALKNFYSEEKKDEDSFNELMNKINNIK